MKKVRIQLSRRLIVTLIVACIFNLLFFITIFFRLGVQEQFFITLDMEVALGWLLGAIFCLSAIDRSKFSRPSMPGILYKAQQMVPVWFGLAFLANFVCEMLVIYYDLHHMPYIGSWPDLAYLSQYPFLFLGVLSLPSYPFSKTTRSRVLLDGLMVMVTVTIFSWYFLFGPAILKNHTVWTTAIIDSMYPFFDLTLVFCFILLVFRTTSPALRPAVKFLAYALPIIVIADCIFDYQTQHNTYQAGSFLYLLWAIGYILIALGVQAFSVYSKQGTVETTRDDNKEDKDTMFIESSSTWRSFLPYALVIAITLLVVYVWNIHGNKILSEGTYLGGCIVIGLVLLRQILTIRETNKHNEQLRLTKEELHIKNQALSEAVARLESLATTDPLTGLPNHRSLLEHLQAEIERAQRYQHPLSIIFFDGDRFKRVNDTYGHAVGDRVLYELGQRVHNVLRECDILGRYGGEEFMVLLPETDAGQARVVAERMREIVAADPLVTDLVENGINTTISIGIAAYPEDGATGADVVAKADEAMYWAKRLGRNQVRTAIDAEQASQNTALASTIHALERQSGPSNSTTHTAEHLSASQMGTLYSLMWLLELRNHDLSTHAYAVSDLATAIAQEIGLDEAEVFAISTASLLHDIGKIALPETIHTTKSLTHSDWQAIKQHPVLGSQLLEASPILRDLIPAVRHHHERWDGTGYPDQLKGEEIPLEARIIAVAEAYHEMITPSPYHSCRAPYEAIRELQACAGSQFDPAIIQAAISVLQRTEQISNVCIQMQR